MSKLEELLERKRVCLRNKAIYKAMCDVSDGSLLINGYSLGKDIDESGKLRDDIIKCIYLRSLEIDVELEIITGKIDAINELLGGL